MDSIPPLDQLGHCHAQFRLRRGHAIPQIKCGEPMGGCEAAARLAWPLPCAIPAKGGGNGAPSSCNQNRMHQYGDSRPSLGRPGLCHAQFWYGAEGSRHPAQQNGCVNREDSRLPIGQPSPYHAQSRTRKDGSHAILYSKWGVPMGRRPSRR